ncbi:hypothetical protein AUR58_00780 [Coxiella burnetii]|nr:hypothetical protein AUR58_00780 [Coxiella burnetii]ATN71745.1 hypothetical protein AYM11_00475 [Coxiella burnetii]MDE3401341.1 hypothetical protein [Coxiella burnetii]
MSKILVIQRLAQYPHKLLPFAAKFLKSNSIKEMDGYFTRPVSNVNKYRVLFLNPAWEQELHSWVGNSTLVYAG